MLLSIQKNRATLPFRALCSFIVLSFLLSTAQVSYAQSSANLPPVGTMISPSTPYAPAVMAGVTIHPENPLQFDFIIDTGDDRLEGETLRQESQKLINYFMASLAVPEDEMWVNLSPNEPDRIIANGLSQTEMGRDMLAQDYLLKQLTASLMYPGEELGEHFWKRVRERAGNVDIPTNMFNKVWIVPNRATVYVSGTNIFVSESHLRVMLEEDYVASEAVVRDPSPVFRKQSLGNSRSQIAVRHDPQLTSDNLRDTSDETQATEFEPRSTVHESPLVSQIIKEIILPEIEREVNTGKNFAPLRQIFNSMILATWYKENLKKSLLGQAYVNQNKIEGINLSDKDAKNKIYNQYIKAFKQGVYDYIKEEYDVKAQEVVPRKYFSGGVDAKDLAVLTETTAPQQLLDPSRDFAMVTIKGDMVGAETSDSAMAGEVLSEDRDKAAIEAELYEILDRAKSQGFREQDIGNMAEGLWRMIDADDDSLWEGGEGSRAVNLIRSFLSLEFEDENGKESKSVKLLKGFQRRMAGFIPGRKVYREEAKYLVLNKAIDKIFIARHLPRLYLLHREVWRKLPEIGLKILNLTLDHLFLTWVKGSADDRKDTNFGHHLVDIIYFGQQLRVAQEMLLENRGQALSEWLNEAISQDGALSLEIARLVNGVVIVNNQDAQKYFDDYDVLANLLRNLDPRGFRYRGKWVGNIGHVLRKLKNYKQFQKKLGEPNNQFSDIYDDLSIRFGKEFTEFISTRSTESMVETVAYRLMLEVQRRLISLGGETEFSKKREAVFKDLFEGLPRKVAEGNELKFGDVVVVAFKDAPSAFLVYTSDQAEGRYGYYFTGMDGVAEAYAAKGSWLGTSFDELTLNYYSDDGKSILNEVDRIEVIDVGPLADGASVDDMYFDDQTEAAGREDYAVVFEPDNAMAGGLESVPDARGVASPKIKKVSPTRLQDSEDAVLDNLTKEDVRRLFLEEGEFSATEAFAALTTLGVNPKSAQERVESWLSSVRKKANRKDEEPISREVLRLAGRDAAMVVGLSEKERARVRAITPENFERATNDNRGGTLGYLRRLEERLKAAKDNVSDTYVSFEGTVIRAWVQQATQGWEKDIEKINADLELVQRKAGTVRAIENLRPKWAQALQIAAVKDEQGLIFARIVRKYEEPHRHYHTLAHIESMFKAYDDLLESGVLEGFSKSFTNEDMAAFIFAIFLHDVVYNARIDGKDEEESVEFAENILVELGVDRLIIERTKQLIGLTKTHQPTSKDIVARLFVDLDLTIFGADWGEFVKYDRNIRREFIQIPFADYVEGRKNILQRFLQKDPLYSIPALQRQFGNKAKKNLRATIKFYESIDKKGEDVLVNRDKAMSASPKDLTVAGAISPIADEISGGVDVVEDPGKVDLSFDPERTQDPTWEELLEEGYDLHLEVSQRPRLAPIELHGYVFYKGEKIPFSEVSLDVFPDQKIVNVHQWHPRFPMRDEERVKDAPKYMKGRGRALWRYIFSKENYEGYFLVGLATGWMEPSWEKMKEYHLPGMPGENFEVTTQRILEELWHSVERQPSFLDLENDKKEHLRKVLQLATIAGQIQKEVGGIDFNPKNLDLKQEGRPVEFQISDPALQNIHPEAIRGIRPVIINITPITNMAPFLGLSDKSNEFNEIELSQI